MKEDTRVLAAFAEPTVATVFWHARALTLKQTPPRTEEARTPHTRAEGAGGADRPAHSKLRVLEWLGLRDVPRPGRSAKGGEVVSVKRSRTGEESKTT